MKRPGELGAADFTDMKDLRITIARKPFVHKLFHFVLPYSHWETVDICFSESYESLTAFWRLGAVPKRYRTNSLTAAVQTFGSKQQFQKNYKELLAAKQELALPKKLKQLSRFDLLIIDEIGYIQQNRDEMEVLFTLLADRY